MVSGQGSRPRYDRTLSPTSPYVTTPLLLCVGVGLGRLIGPRATKRWVAGGLAASSLFFLVGVVWANGPAKGPIGYANANAAVAVQLLALCGLALLSSRGVRRGVVATSLVVALLVVGLNRSAAGLAVAVPLTLVVVLMLMRPSTSARWAAVAGAAAFGGAVAVNLWLADREAWPSWLLRALDPARQTLWQDARTLWAAHPTTGGGPGSFADFSALAADPDTSAVHSSILQVGAETGGVGVALFCALILTGLWLCTRGEPRLGVVAAAGWTALAVHGLVDHLIEYAPVVVAAGVVVGWAGSCHSEELDIPQGEGPVAG